MFSSQSPSIVLTFVIVIVSFLFFALPPSCACSNELECVLTCLLCFLKCIKLASTASLHGLASQATAPAHISPTAQHTHIAQAWTRCFNCFWKRWPWIKLQQQCNADLTGITSWYSLVM
ncbi:hypothetical protein TWF569_006720 [Orbilia oligospora]|nr:hypothetical protein TWF569_006720 [Orbilia oligospora]